MEGLLKEQLDEERNTVYTCVCVCEYTRIIAQKKLSFVRELRERRRYRYNVYKTLKI